MKAYGAQRGTPIAVVIARMRERFLQHIDDGLRRRQTDALITGFVEQQLARLEANVRGTANREATAVDQRGAGA
jgi:hypothetical protein